MEELALVLLERKHVVAALVTHGLCKGAAAKQCIGRDDSTEPRRVENSRAASCSFLPGALRKGQCHACLGGKTVDQVRESTVGALAPLVGSTQRLPSIAIAPFRSRIWNLANTAMDCRRHALEGSRVERAKDVAEDVVARGTLLQRTKRRSISILRRPKSAMCMACRARTDPPPTQQPVSAAKGRTHYGRTRMA